MLTLIRDYERALSSRDVPFILEIANRLIAAGMEAHADELNNLAHFLTTEIFEKHPDSVSNRFKDIVQCDGGGWA